ncbi:MAG: cytochrome c-type biogenesis protein CcmH [Myxococcota bacterium]|nr:cytochrome c-type biogenesis protein CcmH [Myxococcota bacterium]
MARRDRSLWGLSGAARLGLAVGLALAVGVAPSALAADPDAPSEAVDDSWAYEVWHDTMSPYCPGRTLAECPSPQADQLRLWILDQASAGVTRDEVQQVMFQEFGDQILTAPRAEGWGLAAYAIPLAGFVLGGGIVALVVRRLMGPGPGPASPASPANPANAANAAESIDPEIQRRIDEESGA